MKRRAFLKNSLLVSVALSFGAVSGFGKSANKGAKIAVLAASGRAGKLITDEALARGYSVSAFVRDAKKVAPKANLSIVQKDIFALTSAD